MGENLRDALEKIEGKQRDDTKREKYGWWDGECKKSKREVKKMLSKWRNGKKKRRKYREKKKKYKKLCVKQKKKENKRWERVVGEARQEEQVWEVVNKERKKQREINEEIKMRDWEEYFKNLLGGVEKREGKSWKVMERMR